MRKSLIAITALQLFAIPALASPNLDEAADDVCKCLEAPHEQARKAMELLNKAQASGDMSQLVSAQGDMMGVVNASSRCFEALSKKYPEIDKSDELKDKVMAKAEEQCPNPASGMSMRR